MECLVCRQAIAEGAATLTYPCNCPPLHTLCAFQEAWNEYREAEFVGCPHCRAVHWDHRQRNAEIPIFLETPAFKEDLKKLKKKRAATNKVLGAFKRVLQSAYLRFREQILMSLDFIEMTKREALASLKETPEYREARKGLLGRLRIEDKLRRTYNMGYQECAAYRIDAGHRWSRDADMPSKVILRKFRLRI